MHRAGRIAVGMIIVLSMLSAGAPAPWPALAETRQTYIVLYGQAAVPSDAERTIQEAGGTLVYSYPQIGVVIARSDHAAFATSLGRDDRVEGVAATSKFAARLDDGAALADDGGGPPPGDLPNAPATDADSLAPLQWDMRQIHAPEAHAITGGSLTVLVGDIDTGIDFNHPDLKANIDVANSVNCEGGVPIPGLAAQDDNGHGTHTAGTIAAASNGFGIVGVAPNVRIAAIKAANAGGYFFPEAVICAFVWAGTHGVDVVNNSYFADPFLFNCRNDAVQRAIWKAEQRAIRFAMGKGVTVVASEGNRSEDLSHPTQDRTSPDFPPGSEQERAVTNACVVIPVEIPGVIGVTASGNRPQSDRDDDPTDYLKSYYSNFGVATADVAAPGGDARFGITPEAPNGRVLSTWPSTLGCSRRVQETSSDPNEPTAVYCYLQGTSMASPHAAGVAALIISRFGDLEKPQNGKMRPGRVQALLTQTADPQPCPSELPTSYLSVVGANDEQVQACQGGPGHTSWYGSGQVNALRAVAHAGETR